MGGNGEQWGTMGGNGRKSNSSKFIQIYSSFTHLYVLPPISPHFSPFPPISPHFPPFSLAFGTLWGRLWVHCPPPEPGHSEPCRVRQVSLPPGRGGGITQRNRGADPPCA